jgi:nucleotide-binding universal stress UspA family protein
MKVLLATDGTPTAERATAAVAERAWPADTEIEVVTVIHTRFPLLPDPQLMLAAAHQQLLAQAREQAPSIVRHAARRIEAESRTVRVTTKIVEGEPKASILQEARDWGADLIVLGSHGHGALTGLLLGSVAQAVALHAPCSVLIVRPER